MPPFTVSVGRVRDGALQDGDILDFVPADATGDVINFATGNYGYSHVGLVCGSQMVDVDNVADPVVPQVEVTPLATALQRGHVGIHLGLTNAQAQQLCSCVHAQVGQPMFKFMNGTLSVELCTSLIMDCLDEIGFNRAAIGIGGFVTPNSIAQVFAAPPGDIIVTSPGALINEPGDLKFFMAGSDGHLWENYYNNAWLWTDHGTPAPDVRIVTSPGALINEPGDLKFFMAGSDGHLWENYWNNAWLWTDHGMAGQALV
jgi:hypothetical protein